MRKALPWIYLLLAVLGAILPWKANLEFIAESGGQAFDLARFIADASSTAASRSLSADLLVGASVHAVDLCGRTTSEDQRLVAGHPPELRCGLCLRCSVFLVPAGTSTAARGRLNESESTSSATTSMVRSLAGVETGLPHWPDASRTGVGVPQTAQTAAPFRPVAPQAVQLIIRDCKSFQPIQPRPERIKGSAKRASNTPPARSSKRRPAAVGSSRSNTTPIHNTAGDRFMGFNGKGPLNQLRRVKSKFKAPRCSVPRAEVSQNELQPIPHSNTGQNKESHPPTKPKASTPKHHQSRHRPDNDYPEKQYSNSEFY